MFKPEHADNGDGTWKPTVGAVDARPDAGRRPVVGAHDQHPGPHVRMPPSEKELSRQPYCRHDRPMTSLIDLLPTTAADRSVRGRQQRDRRRRPAPDHA
ncbi:hypothetical protein ABB07_35790 [Streptomyces incarnatus]|uniref:Uncharacterized protein n=1 Tax=Streptomyces incarnatus TaxID=665007 RepID=A0ABM5TVT9_9ACTN|nr:hypothetical protein ABB07_35790 [Streptomyces incarnatus]